MSTITTRVWVALLLVSGTLPFVTAGCDDGEFWFQRNSLCLPLGKPSWSSVPPAGKHCPPKHWSWSHEQNCCTPHHPDPSPPQCGRDWEWSDDEFCCKRRLQRRQAPVPSGMRRALPKPRSPSLCPSGLTACPITSVSGPTTDFECLDTVNELESCGGCTSVGKGQDCTAIRGAWNVGCQQGSCTVYTCAVGFKRSRDDQSCISV